MKDLRIIALITEQKRGAVGKKDYNAAQILKLECNFLMSATHRLLKFGVFELNLDTEELRKFGTLLKLPPQPFRLLALLAACSGQVLTREEIKEQLWGEDTYVDFEHGMNKCINQIRTALGDDANKAVYIETVPRRGYRFLVPVVAKTVLAPPPRVKESSSGIPADLAELIRARMAARKSGVAEAQPGPAVDAQPTTADAQPAAAIAAPVEVIPAPDESAAPALARDWDWRWIAMVSFIIVALIAVAIYWYLR